MSQLWCDVTQLRFVPGLAHDGAFVSEWKLVPIVTNHSEILLSTLMLTLKLFLLC